MELNKAYESLDIHNGLDLHESDITNVGELDSESATVGGARQFELFETVVPGGQSSFSVGPTGLGQVRVIFSGLETVNSADTLRLKIGGTDPVYRYIRNDGTFVDTESSIRIGTVDQFKTTAMTGQLLITQLSGGSRIHIQGPVGADRDEIPTALLAGGIQGGGSYADIDNYTLDFFLEGSATFQSGNEVFVEYRPL